MNPADSFMPTQLEQASSWWVRLREDDVSPQELSRWLDWCQSDPANLQAFEKIESLGGCLVALDSATRAALVRDLLEEPAVIHKPRFHRRGRLAVWAGCALAASLSGVLLCCGLWQQRALSVSQSGTYVTRKAQSQEVTLPDGSELAIGADSTLAVHYTGASRNLQLNSGEAFFQVQHNPQRPFVVQAGRLKVVAVGTAFNIRKTGNQVEVIVTQGVVDVEDGAGQFNGAGSPALPKEGVLRVAAGQLVVADRRSASLTVRSVDTATAVSWRSGSMSFLDEDLPQVVANLNRYSSREVRIGDPALDRLRFTGSVLQGHEEEWLSAVQKVYPVVVRQAGDGRALVIEPRDARSGSGGAAGTTGLQ